MLKVSVSISELWPPYTIVMHVADNADYSRLFIRSRIRGHSCVERTHWKMQISVRTPRDCTSLRALHLKFAAAEKKQILRNEDLLLLISEPWDPACFSGYFSGLKSTLLFKYTFNVNKCIVGELSS